MTEDVPNPAALNNGGRRFTFASFLFALMLCTLVISMCGIVAAFGDLAYARTNILDAVASISRQLSSNSSGAVGGLTDAQLETFVARVEAVSQRGLDLNSMQVLFGAFSLAFVSVSAFMLQRSYEMVERLGTQTESSHRRIRSAEDRVSRLAAQIRLEQEAINQAHKEVMSFTKTVEEQEARSTTALSRVESAEAKIVHWEERLARVSSQFDALPLLAKNLAFGTDLIGLTSVATLHLHLFQDSSDSSYRLAHLVALRDRLQVIVDHIHLASDSIGLDRETFDLVFDEIQKISLAGRDLDESVSASIQGRCQAIVDLMLSTPLVQRNEDVLKRLIDRPHNL